MASLWQKTLFYLGLVDEDQDEVAEEAVVAQSPQAQVRRVEGAKAAAASSSRASRAAAPPPSEPRTSGGIAGRRIEPPSRQRRRISSDPEHAEAGVLVRPGSGESRPLSVAETGGGETEIIVARTFSDAQLLADHIRANRPVVLDLRNAETAMVRRLVDFASGLTYGLSGKMVKTAQGVILVTPSGVMVGIEERRRLASLGLYAASSES